MVSGFAVWFALAWHYYGEISIATLGGTLPCMFANLTSMFVPLPVTLAISFLRPSAFDWKEFRRIKKVSDATTPHHQTEHTAPASSAEDDDDITWFTPERVKYMKRMSKVAAFWAVATVLGHILLWPLPMYGAKMIFGRSVRA